MTKDLQTQLDFYTRPAELCQDTEHGPVCVACAHKCRLTSSGARGVCALRSNKNGTIQAPWGYVSGLAFDPIEKKPLYHFLPGSSVLSFGMLGCNFKCDFCQNWLTSQVVKDPAAQAALRPCDPEDLLALAREHDCRAVASTYNEPLITSEWAAAVFRQAREAGLQTCYVTNGFASPEVLDYLEPWLDAANVDLKCFTDAGYRHLGGRLPPVLDTISTLVRQGKWVETTTLLVPEFNDEPGELTELAEFLASLNPDMPWHVSAYHADYKRRGGTERTTPEALQKAVDIGRKAGLRYIYTGNMPGFPEVGQTSCHNCGTAVVKRGGFKVSEMKIDANGNCPQCQNPIPGRWLTG